MNAKMSAAVEKLSKVAHVCEVKAPYVLVHAAPTDLAEIVAMGFAVSAAKRGKNYYAVKVTAGEAANDATPPAPPPAAAPKGKPANDTTAALTNDTMVIGGTEYTVVETPCKRKVDVRRWEVSKGDGSKPYVVTFQSADGSSTACSCKGGIFHKHCKHMDALRAAFGKKAVAA